MAGDNDFIVPLHVIRSFAIKAIESFNSAVSIPSPELLVIPSADHFQVRTITHFTVSSIGLISLIIARQPSNCRLEEDL